MNYYHLCLIALIFFTLNIVSCVSSKKVVYLDDLNVPGDTTADSLKKAQIIFETPIQKNDLLSIAVGGSNSDDLTTLNSGSGIIPGGTAGGAASRLRNE